MKCQHDSVIHDERFLNFMGDVIQVEETADQNVYKFIDQLNNNSLEKEVKECKFLIVDVLNNKDNEEGLFEMAEEWW